MSADPLPDHAFERVGALMREVAAVELLPRFQALAGHEIDRKRGGSLVTVADLASERRLTDGLLALLPGSVAVGEEAVEADPRVRDRIGSASVPVWIIDPLDGTQNFAEGKPRFTVIVALAVGGETVAGWILDPLSDRLAAAQRGAGATLDGEPARVPRPTALEALSGGWNLGKFTEEQRTAIRNRRSRFAHIENFRCAGHEYLKLVDGTLHFRLYGQIHPWDHAAGVLLHQEAGGASGMLDGGPYRPTLERGTLLLAPDAAWLVRLRRFFLEPESLDELEAGV
ncbi:MAG: inositol monophosphatase [Alphaproteobacteria bacterium]|nr:inositol monophosphatase [Alphaproteobacteria bacterium]